MVSNQERVIVARVRYMISSFDIFFVFFISRKEDLQRFHPQLTLVVIPVGLAQDQRPKIKVVY